MIDADVGGVLRFAIAAVRAAVIDLPVAVGPAAAAAARCRFLQLFILRTSLRIFG